MTVNELLGIEEEERQRTEERDGRMQQFPSFDEFNNSRASYTQNRGGIDTYERADRRAYPEADSRRDAYAPRDAYSTRDTYSANDYAGYSDRRDWFGYASTDYSRADEQNLMGRLEYTNESFRPVYDKNVESKSQTAKKEGLRARLTTKGKILVCSLAALIVTTVGLIIGYAGKINKGTALMPASNSNASEISVTQTI